MITRFLLGGAGVLLAAFGGYRLLTEVDPSDLRALATWMIAALVLHDGVLAPVVAVLGVVLTRVVPPRARRHLQGALVVGAAVTVIALPLIHREGTQPAAKALLVRDYGADLALLWAVVAAAATVLYATRVVRDRRADQHSSVGVS